jgi:hypothetical protein
MKGVMTWVVCLLHTDVISVSQGSGDMDHVCPCLYMVNTILDLLYKHFGS